jgi:hypothetical protein
MAKHFVCLTFDLDNTSGALTPESSTPTWDLRGDFGMAGGRSGCWRCCGAMRCRHLVHPRHTIESYPDICGAVRAGAVNRPSRLDPPHPRQPEPRGRRAGAGPWQ